MVREITIKAVLNGYIVSVGCQTVVFNSRAEMLTELNGYLADPGDTERRYREKAVNRQLLSQETPAENPVLAQRPTTPLVRVQCAPGAEPL